MNRDTARLKFGEAHLNFLIAAEIVSRGTGPNKYKGEEEFYNPAIFDTCLLDEEELQGIWLDSLIQDTRKLAFTSPDERGPNFENEFAEARTEVWRKFVHLYRVARKKVELIENEFLRAVRLEELESVKANYDFAGAQLGLGIRQIDFSEAQLIISGSEHEVTLDEIDQKRESLNAKLEEKGFEGGSLEERMKSLRDKLTYYDIGKIPGEYERIFNRFCGRIEEYLGLEKGFLKPDVGIMSEHAKQSGTGEYEGGGKFRTVIKPTDEWTKLEMIYYPVHESGHGAQGLAREKAHILTNDKFDAVGTMCSSSAPIDEGGAKHHYIMLDKIIKDEFGDDIGVAEIADELDDLHDLVVNYSARRASLVLDSGTKQKLELVAELTKFHLLNGFSPEKSGRIAEALVTDINREHKNRFYTPFYGQGADILKEFLSRFETPEQGYMAYIQMLSHTNLTSRALLKYGYPDQIPELLRGLD